MQLSYTERGNARIHIIKILEKRAFYRLMYLAYKNLDLTDEERGMVKEILDLFHDQPHVRNHVDKDDPEFP